MNILLVHTGGTIGSCSSELKIAREQDADTVKTAKRDLITAFLKSGSEYVDSIEFVDAGFPEVLTTLSESMTLDKLYQIAKLINQKLNSGDLFSGVVVLHGTDTLAYTASLFSFLFSDISVPMFLVSGNRPPKDPLSNASANFICAVESICKGIAPNVYVTYRNADSKMRLYLASCIMQSSNFSEDFISAAKDRMFEVTEAGTKHIFDYCQQLCDKRSKIPFADTSLENMDKLTDRVLILWPHTGLDYSMCEHCLNSADGNNYKGIVHGTYHSGTVSWPGLVLLAEAEKLRRSENTVEADKYEAQALAESESVYSIRYLARLCEKNGVPLYIAPSSLSIDQYETMNVVSANTNARLLHMTTEAAYMKLVVGLSFNMPYELLDRYMQTPINNEFI